MAASIEMVQERRHTLIGVSLKMYLDHKETLAWCREVAAIVAGHPAVTSGAVDLFILPTFPSLAAAVDIFAGTDVKVGAQDLFWEDRGAYTGAVSGIALDQIGCSYVAVGHAERRLLFGETAEAVALKVVAAQRNGLTPVLCIGELDVGEVTWAIAGCTDQLMSVLGEHGCLGQVGPLVVAYEPQWAIGAEEPASPDHVRDVCHGIRSWLAACGRHDVPVIYGGSAGPGLLTALGSAVDGLFLGRSVHDPEAMRRVLDEAMAAEPHIV